NKTYLDSYAQSVLLNGTLSKDSDGWIAGFSWKLVSGPGNPHIANSTSGEAYAKDLKAGAYTFRVTVTDNQGATSYDDVVITVNKDPKGPKPDHATKRNKAPVPRAGADQVIHLPQTSTRLNATTSYDPDGYVAAFHWKKIVGPSSY